MSEPEVRARSGRQGDILETFTALVARQGYDMTSVAEIADELRLSKGTIMYHFGSKDQILKQLSLEYMQRRLGELEAIVAQFSGADERLRAVVAGLVCSYRDDRDASVAFSREFMRFADEPVMDEVRDLRRRYVDLLQAVIEGGAADGTFRHTDAKVVALQLIGMCNWTWTWLRPEGRLSVEEIAAVFADTLLAGLVVGSPAPAPAVGATLAP
jgi:AcrR family transcriptional regulator